MSTKGNDVKIAHSASNEHILRAKKLANQLGVRSAAGYLRNRGYNLKDTMWILLGVNILRTDVCLID
jgi:hypothetical protein